MEQALKSTDPENFFLKYYGAADAVLNETPDGKDIATDAAWRRINADDAADAGGVALAMNPRF